MANLDHSGSISLGAVAARAEWLVVACRKCDRKGRLLLARLLAFYGPDFPMTELRRVLAGDCPRLLPSASINDRCDAHFPELPQIMGAGATGPR
jgi:hypothetical protein